MNEDLINVSIIYFLDYNYFTYRAMRIFLLLILMLIQSSCTTVEVAKEVTKATKSIKKSVDKIINTEEKKDEAPTLVNDSIEQEKEILEVEKKKEKKLFKEQKKIIEINFLDKTLNELKRIFGEPQLLRLDGDVQTARFDTNTCRFFLFFNSNVDFSHVKHFEIRDNKGNLINTKEKIQECYKDLNLT